MAVQTINVAITADKVLLIEVQKWVEKLESVADAAVVVGPMTMPTPEALEDFGRLVAGKAMRPELVRQVTLPEPPAGRTEETPQYLQYVWTTESALRAIRMMQPVMNTSGWYVALAGAVLSKGMTDEDLELVAVPKHEQATVTALQAAIEHSIGKITDTKQYSNGYKQLRCGNQKIDIAVMPMMTRGAEKRDAEADIDVEKAKLATAVRVDESGLPKYLQAPFTEAVRKVAASVREKRAQGRLSVAEALEQGKLQTRETLVLRAPGEPPRFVTVHGILQEPGKKTKRVEVCHPCRDGDLVYAIYPVEYLDWPTKGVDGKECGPDGKPLAPASLPPHARSQSGNMYRKIVKGEELPKGVVSTYLQDGTPVYLVYTLQGFVRANEGDWVVYQSEESGLVLRIEPRSILDRIKQRDEIAKTNAKRERGWKLARDKVKEKASRRDTAAYSESPSEAEVQDAVRTWEASHPLPAGDPIPDLAALSAVTSVWEALHEATQQCPELLPLALAEWADDHERIVNDLNFD